MATSREVAEAYIEVHGDLSPFRKDLNDAGKSAEAAGINMADEFSDGWNKRIKSGVQDRWESLLNAMYNDTPLDWQRLIGKFDTTDLDRASVQIEDFMNKMRSAGKLTEDQYDEVTQAVREAIKAKQNEMFVQKDLANLTRDHTEAIKENIKFDKLRADQAKLAEQISRDHATALRMNEQMQMRFLKDHAAALRENQAREMQFLKDHAAAIRINENMKMSMLRDHAAAIRINNQLDAERPGIISRSTAAMTGLKERTGEAGDKTGILNVLTEKLRTSWARMDSTVRLAIGAIISAAGPLATLGSGIAGSVTAIASSLAYSVGALGAMVGPAVAFGTAIALAISSFDEIRARIPRIGESLDRISANWSAQADRFGRQWEGALDSLLNSFATKMEAFDFGTPLGQAFAEITAGFDRVVNGPSFNAFMTEMTTNFPAAVSGMGRGLAGLTDGFLALFAGAGPVAKQLGEDFARWGQKIGEALEKARASGEINALFERMRTSLLIVLDLAGSLGMALGTLFELGSASGNRMLVSLTQIVDQFNAWMKSDAGRQTMLTWFNNAERIMRAIEPLAVGLGRAMALLVTERSISLFESLMSTMGELLPIIAQVLDVISNLGILNIVAEAFLVVGKAIQPLLPAFAQIATLLGDLLIGAFQALEPLLVAVGTALAPIAQAAADLWAQIAPALLPALQQLIAVLTPLIVMVINLAAAIITQLIPVIGPLFVQYINATMTAFTVLMTVITSVVSFITTLATTLINFFANLGTNIANFNATVNQMLADFWAGISTAFQTFIAGFQAGWDAFWTGLGAGLTALWLGITTEFTNGWTNLTTGFTNWVAQFQAGWDAFWLGLGEGLKAIWLSIVTLLTGEWNKIVEGVQNTLIAPFQQFWSGFWNALDPETRAYIEGITLAIRLGWEKVQADLGKFISDFVNGWNGFWGDVARVNEQKWNETVQGFNKWSTDINNTVNNFINSVVSGWNKFWGDVGSRASQGWSEIVNGFNNWANQVNSTVNNFINNVIAGWNRFWADLGAKVAQGWNDIVSRFTNGLSQAQSQVSSWVGTVQAIWNSFWGTVTNYANAMMSVFTSTINNKLNEAANFFRNLPGQVGAALGGLANQLYSIGANAIASLGNAIRNGAGAIIGALTAAVGGAINAAKRMLGIASPSKVFTEFGLQTDAGFIRGIERGEAAVKNAAAHMTEQALEAFDRSKARLAGQETARGLAEGLESSKARVQAALGKLDPNLTAAYSATVAATAGRIGTPATTTTAPAQKQIIFAEDSIKLETRATDPRVITGILLDSMDALVGRSNI